MFLLSLVIHAARFRNVSVFTAVVMVFGGVSLLTNQELCRFWLNLVLNLRFFERFGLRSFTERSGCLDDFETGNILAFN